MISIPILGQEETFKTPDSLKEKSYNYLYTQVRKNYTDTISALLYLNTSLAKATFEKQKIEKAITLNILATYEKDRNRKIQLIEQAILESDGIDDRRLITVFTHIGSIYHDYYEYDSALKCFIKALDLAEKFNIEKYQFILFINIAKVKEGIGKHEEALDLYRKVYTYGVKNYPEDTIGGIIDILNLAESFKNSKQHDSASFYYNKIIDVAYQKSPFYGDVLTINEGINLYYKKKYPEAEKFLQKGSSKLDINPESHIYHILSQLYLGKIQETHYNDIEKTKSLYLQVDSTLTSTDLIVPNTEDAYEFLIKYYKEKEDLKNQLDFTKKLLHIRTVTSSIATNTTNKLHSEFDTPQLLKSKQALIERLQLKTDTLQQETSLLNTRSFFLGTFILVLLTLFILQYIKHRKHRKRFQDIIKQLETPKEEIKTAPSLSTESATTQKLNIDEEVITTVLEKLDRFEKKNEFLQSDISITILAKKCTTNTKYLSKIINTHKSKSFINYINDLRIDYILKELKENTTLQRYTIKSISEEAGFNTAESFATAFKKKTGIKPSYYIKNLKSNT
jgi:AraC-like DNA-binding protein